MICETSWASTVGLSISTVPFDCPKPRGSQVMTLYPAFQSDAMSSEPKMPAEVGSFDPDSPQPGPMKTVGAVTDVPVCADNGNQWMRIRVPSYDVRLYSEAAPATFCAGTES